MEHCVQRDTAPETTKTSTQKARVTYPLIHRRTRIFLKKNENNLFNLLQPDSQYCNMKKAKFRKMCTLQ